MRDHQDYYIYCHYEADTGLPFYVGKGRKGRMSTSDGRNKYWHRVAKKHGWKCKKLADGLDNELAYFAEMEKIDQLRRLGFRLTNFTDGGDGASGYSHSIEDRKLMSELALARWTDEKRAAHAEITKMHFTSEERRIKQSLAVKNYFDTPGAREKCGMLTKQFYINNPEARELARAKALAAIQDPEKNAKMLAAMKDPEVRKRMSEGSRNKPILQCPHCEIQGASSQMKRWHFDNCKTLRDIKVS